MDVAAAGAHRLIRRQAQFPGDQVAHGFIFIGQEHIAGEARQAAGGGQVVVVHVVLNFVK